MLQLPASEIMQKHVVLREVPGCPAILAHQTDDVFALWQAWEVETGVVQEIPFWAIVWPGAIMLAGYILRHSGEFAGKTVLDLGCGGAVAGIAAARTGATAVIANDLDPAALGIAVKNAEANQVSLKPDRTNYLASRALSSVEIVLVADMFYHSEQARRLTDLLTEAVKSGCQVFIADGQRAFAPKTNVRVLATETIPVNFDLEGVHSREVRLLNLITNN